MVGASHEKSSFVATRVFTDREEPRALFETALDQPQHFGNRIDLDGGAGYGRPLRPAVFEGTDAWILTADGRVPLVP